MTAAHARQSPRPIATRPRKITEGDLQLTAAGGQAQIFEMTVHGGKGAQSSLEVLPVSEPHRRRQALRGSGEAIDRQLGSIAVTVGSI